MKRLSENLIQKAYSHHYQDSSGEWWTDMLSGILNVSLGHSHGVVQDALREVVRNGLINSYDRECRNSYELKELLNAYDHRYQWKLLNTGAEAIERAIQIASVIFDRKIKIAVLPYNFHGKSLSMSCVRYNVPWGNPMDIIRLDLTDPEPFDVLIYEPVRGWDGVAHDEAQLRKLCDENNALLIADEMITGFLRCGRRFLNTSADMVISGKGLSQGVPLTVLGIGHHSMPESLPIGWSTTCGGNNLSSTVGLRVLQFLIENENELQEQINRIETKLSTVCQRTKGALGFRDCNNASSLCERFDKNHIVASWHDNILRLGPDFCMGSELDTVCDIIKKYDK